VLRRLNQTPGYVALSGMMPLARPILFQ
jgi:hypothetical protein